MFILLAATTMKAGAATPANTSYQPVGVKSDVDIQLPVQLH